MTRINLLPAEERAKAAREQGIALAILGLVILVVLLGAVYLLSYRQVSPKQDKIDAKQAEIDVANRQIAELKPYETMQAQLKTLATTTQQIYAARVIWSSILEEISLLIPDGVALQGLTATVPAPMVAGSAIGLASAPVTATTASVDVKFSCMAKDYTDVPTFMVRLGLMPQLANIRLAGTTNNPGDATTGAISTWVFEIDTSLRPFVTAPPLAVPAAGGAQ